MQNKRNLFLLWLWCACLMLIGQSAIADTMPTQFSSFAGYVNFVGAQRTLRTGDNTSNGTASSLVSGTTTASGSAPTTANISGIPSGATIRAAYLYWAGSGDIPDYTVTFEGSTITASRQYTITDAAGIGGINYFSGVADVTAAVAAKRNGTYTFSGLTVDNGDPWYSSQAVLAGWAVLVIYENQATEKLRVLNVYEGFQPFYGSNIPLTISNFVTPSSNIDGRLGHLTWEGDVTNSSSMNGFSEQLRFNSTILSDANNPVGNQFNSVSTIGGAGAVDNASYGIDFDAYDIGAYLTAGMTSATSVYSSGSDLVLLSMEVMSVSNTPVSDLGISMTLNGILDRGQNANYVINVSNFGPNNEAGPITVTDTLPAGLSFVSGSGNGWTCSASAQTVTCTYSGSLASGASAPTLTLTVGVGASASGTITNSATVAGSNFDNNNANNTATDSHDVANADLALTMTRNSNLVNGQNASYSLAVSNGGPFDEPSPITLTDTLPAGLTYVSASGAGWSCAASGQNVNCTYNASVASGASASTLVLTVAVASNASGTVVNTATVTGPRYDPDTADNTATDTSTFLPAAYAYYAMDEAAWTAAAGAVKDGSGNLRDGTALGGITTVSTPASGIKGDTCRGGNIPANTSPGTVQAVDTGITVNSLGNAGTVSFWYKSNVRWNPGGNSNDRTLIDATGSASGREFWLVLDQFGQLQFKLDNANGTLQSVTANQQTFAANTWHHIAITWDFGAHTMTVYLDGAQIGSRNRSGVTSNSAYGSIFLGDGKNVSGLSTPNRGYSANGVIDETRIYSGALNANQITADMNASHSCLDHYELSMATNSITCLPTTVTVKACADGSSPCLNTSSSVNGYTANLGTNGGALGATTVAFDGTGVATTSLSYPLAADGTPVSVTLSGEQIVANNPRKCCPDGANCVVANSCLTTFNTAGFIFSDQPDQPAVNIPNQVAGVSSAKYYLRAIKSNTSTKACETALAGAQAVTLSYQCNDPNSCYTSNPPACGNSSGYFCLQPYDTAQAPMTKQPVSTTGGNVTLYFDNNGNASFDFIYDDVGRITLAASKTVNGAPLAGANTFVVKPYDFLVVPCTSAPSCSTAPSDPGLTGSGSVFAKAENPFTVTVTARSKGGRATPSFGLGSNNATETVNLTQNLQAPIPANSADKQEGALGGTTAISRSSFADGVASVTNLTWNEVGVITLTATNSNFLGNGLSTTGTSGNIGRFIPDHFETVLSGGITPCSSGMGACPVEGFVYSAQPFITKVNATSKTGTQTKNYNGSFARNVVLTAWDAKGSTTTQNPPSASSGTLSNSSVDSSLFSAPPASTGGSAVLDGSSALAQMPAYTLPNAYPAAASPPAPTTIYLRATENAGDGVTSLQATPANSVEGGMKIVSGRFWVQNAYGSELLPLPIGGEMQYFNGTRWQISDTDGTSGGLIIAPANVQFSNYKAPLSSVTVRNAPVTFNISNGVCPAPYRCFVLTAPGSGHNGSVDIKINGPAWLPSSTGRATFGVYKSGPVIYIREMY